MSSWSRRRDCEVVAALTADVWLGTIRWVLNTHTELRVLHYTCCTWTHHHCIADHHTPTTSETSWGERWPQVSRYVVDCA